MNTYAVTTVHNERNIFLTLCGLLFLSSFFYIYCIATTIHNVVAREAVEVKIADVTLAIGQKEFDYINLKNTITPQRVLELGFTEVNQKTFITPQSVGFISSTRTETAL
jgi:hypothetical protein